MVKFVADTLVMGKARRRPGLRPVYASRRSLWAALLLFSLAAAVPSLQAREPREKDKLPYGEGLIVNVPYPEPVVEQVVQDVAQNGIIRGTKEYNKDQYVEGAKAADSTSVFS